MIVLDKLKSVELDLLKMFSSICQQERLTWYAMFGTLLGAARHAGFIPWDDDIDVAMPRIDYDRLRHCPELFAKPYFLQTPKNDPAAAPRFMRLRRSNTTVISGFPNGFTRGGNMGAYIDILPLDDVPNMNTTKRLHSAAMRMQKQLFACAALDENEGTDLPDWKAEYCYGYGGISGIYSLVAEHYEMVLSGYSAAPYYAIPSLNGIRGCRVYDKNWFLSQEKMAFEGIDVFVPSGWKELLVACYPEGLLEPEADERQSKHIANKTIIDMERPYKEYVKRYTDMLLDIGDSKVYLFGAGDSLKVWLERYAKGLNIVCAFDNSEKKWGTKACDVLVNPPEELPMLLDENSRLIIVSIWYKEIEKQLRSMDIDDYFVFIDGLNYRREENAGKS